MIDSVPHDYAAPPDLLAGRVVLVTGAGAGLGRAAALAYARHGATVILLGRTQKKLEAVYDEIESHGAPEAVMLPADLARLTITDYERIASGIEKDFGRLDGLLHSAADLGTLTPLAHYDPSLWQRVLQVNLNAPYLLTRACLDLLKRPGEASVIFTSSDVARHGRAYWGTYAVAGAAIENLVRVWADELGANTRVRMNSLDPGPVRTALRARAYPGENPDSLRTPMDLEPAYLYLMGPDSRGITGQALSAPPVRGSGQN